MSNESESNQLDDSIGDVPASSLTGSNVAASGSTSNRVRLTLAQMSNRSESDVALVDDTSSVTWLELETLTHRYGQGFKSHGLQPGDHIAIIVSNRVEFVVALFAATRAGLMSTPIKTNWTPTEIAYVLEDAGSKAIVTDTDNGRRAAVDGGLALVDLDDDIVGWLEGQSDELLPLGAAGARIPYTSGTTGRPKGVRRSIDQSRTFEEYWASIAAMATGLGLPRDGVHLMVSKLFHGAPLLFGTGALAMGATLHIQGNWNASETLTLLKTGVSATIMVPTMLRQLLALPSAERSAFDPSGLKTVLHGGESCSKELKAQMIEWWGPVFTEYYGFTEGGMTTCSTQEWLDRPGTVGKAFPSMEVLIVGDDDTELLANETGTVYFRTEAGRNAFSYSNAQEKTDSAFRSDGSFSVGDIGHLDDDGYLFLSGRSAELIVSSGVNIYPAEIESVLFEVEGVLDAAVAGGPDPDRGETPVAFISLVPGVDEGIVLRAIEDACSEFLANDKKPRVVHVRDEIPRDPTGKALRIQLRNELLNAISPQK